jgi:hypothetical protein
VEAKRAEVEAKKLEANKRAKEGIAHDEVD